MAIITREWLGSFLLGLISDMEMVNLLRNPLSLGVPSAELQKALSKCKLLLLPYQPLYYYYSGSSEVAKFNLIFQTSENVSLEARKNESIQIFYNLAFLFFVTNFLRYQSFIHLLRGSTQTGRGKGSRRERLPSRLHIQQSLRQGSISQLRDHDLS